MRGADSSGNAVGRQRYRTIDLPHAAGGRRRIVRLAIGSGAIRQLRDIVTTKIPLGSAKTARDRGAVQSAVAEAETMLRSARLFFYDALTKAWQRAVAQQPFALEDKADLMLASTWAARSAARATDLMHRMRHHGFVSESRLETVGQVYLGVPPEFPFVAF
jgi:alkylation response protein AidB-like acyl-CoA dehydrogenase